MQRIKVISPSARQTPCAGPSAEKPAVSLWEYVLFGVLAAACWLAFDHPDILETARHAYILIRSTLDGDFFNFFENTLARTYGEYTFVNAAHYNILMYVIYAVWELPLFLAERIGGFAFCDETLALWCKAIGCGAYFGCGLLMKKLAMQLGAGEGVARRMPLAFWLDPVAFFTTLAMGQYDSLCLLFLLWALTYYFEDRPVPFCLLMGVGIVFKFFPLFLLIPLLLLAEKRFWYLVRDAAISLWLYLPTALLFWGRTGDAGAFNYEMLKRLLSNSFAGGSMNASNFGLGMVLLCAAAYLIHPEAVSLSKKTAALYAGVAVFSLLFLFVQWHPQWVILIVPFLLLTTVQQRSPSVFGWTRLAFCCGYFLMVAMLYSRALEANLLDFGAFRTLLPAPYSSFADSCYNASFFYPVPGLYFAASVAFYGALLCDVFFKLPLGSRSLAERLSGGRDLFARFDWRLVTWGTFAVAFGGVWLLPSLISLLKTLAVL